MIQRLIFFTFARPPTFSPRDIEVDGHVLHLPDAWTDDQVDAAQFPHFRR
jgi:hypothetical protein